MYLSKVDMIWPTAVPIFLSYVSVYLLTDYFKLEFVSVSYLCNINLQMIIVNI